MIEERIGQRRYALLGVRIRLEELAAELTNLKRVFPGVSAIAGAQAALVAAIDDIDSERTQGRATPPTKPIEPPRKRINGKRRIKGPPRAHLPIKLGRNGRPAPRNSTENAIAVGRLSSWLTGRDVLRLLADSEHGMTVTEIAKPLGLSPNACDWRLRVREKHGHVRLVDGDTKTYMITAGGLDALREDRDTND